MADVPVPEGPNQRFIKRTGVVLSRANLLHGNSTATIFLRDSGVVRVFVHGGSRGVRRFGASLEPLIWGHFQMYQSRHQMYIKEIDVTDDMWKLRHRPMALRPALVWSRLLIRNLLEGYPYNDVLALFYWALKALEAGVDPDAVGARFMWRWLYNWGVAPDLVHCSYCGKPMKRAAWHEGALICGDCAHEIAQRGDGSTLVTFHKSLDAFARYAYSKSFIPAPRESITSEARLLQRMFLYNLEENR